MPITDKILRTALDAIPHGALLFDAARRPIFANAAAKIALQATEARLEDSVARFENEFLLVDPDTEEVISAERLPLSRALNGETVRDEEYLLRPKNWGAVRWVEIGARPITDAADATAG